MKRLLFFFLIFWIISTSTNAQNKDSLIVYRDTCKKTTACCCEEFKSCFDGTKDITTQPTEDFILDFKSKKLGFPANYKNIRKRSFVRVKVVNYNPYLYKVVVEGKDSSIVQPTDGGMLSFFLNPDKLTAIAAGILSLPDATPPSINSSKVSSKNKQAFLKSKTLSESYQYTARTGDTTSKVQNIIQKAIANIDTDRNNILQLRKGVEEKVFEISRQILLQYKLYPECKDFDKDALASLASKYERELKTQVETNLEKNKSVYEEFKNYRFEIAPYYPFIQKNIEWKIRHDLIDSFYRMALSELASIDTAINYKKISELLIRFEKLAQNSSCYVSLPIYLFDDAKTITIELKPIGESSTLPPYQTSFAIPGYQNTVSGISAGVFVSGLHNNLYTNKQKVNDTTFNLVSDNVGKIQIGINALAYFATQIGTKANYFGGCFGAGMSIENKPKPRILLGISYVSGEKNRFMISLGLAGGFVSTLSNAYSTDVQYLKAAANYQKDIIKSSAFISMNYSFLSK